MLHEAISTNSPLPPPLPAVQNSFNICSNLLEMPNEKSIRERHRDKPLITFAVAHPRPCVAVSMMLGVTFNLIAVHYTT